MYDVRQMLPRVVIMRVFIELCVIEIRDLSDYTLVWMGHGQLAEACIVFCRLYCAIQCNYIQYTTRTSPQTGGGCFSPSYWTDIIL